MYNRGRRNIPKNWRKSTEMKSRKILSIAAAAMCVAAAGGVQAATGDPAAGAQKNSMCIGCHGIPDYRTAFPEVYSVPRLGGQHAAYIVNALQEYKSGARSHPSMRAIAGGLSDQDMADLAAYYSSGPAKPAAK
jgi:cytochrome c553